jgi:hypothetical protein
MPQYSVDLATLSCKSRSTPVPTRTDGALLSDKILHSYVLLLNQPISPPHHRPLILRLTKPISLILLNTSQTLLLHINPRPNHRPPTYRFCCSPLLLGEILMRLGLGAGLTVDLQALEGCAFQARGIFALVERVGAEFGDFGADNSLLPVRKLGGKGEDAVAACAFDARRGLVGVGVD